MNLPTIDYLKKCKYIHYFGLGFIQIKMDDNHRYHFYNNTLPKVTPREEVHNHRYNFLSKIIKGTLNQWIIVPTTGTEYVIENETCNPAIPSLDATSEYCNIKIVNAVIMSTNTQYFLHRDTFHRVESENCITYIKREKPIKSFAQVIRRTGTPKVCPFSHKVHEAVLWEIVESMLKE